MDYKKELASLFDGLNLDQQVNLINDIREYLHSISPFKNEPVDLVRWVKSEDVVANDYNPNKVAPPEMELLEISIMNDGYTQPIVTWDNQEKNKIEVIDGFHRSRVGKESKIVRSRINGYLPIVGIRTEQSDKNDRIASTIRHNRARGKHQIDAMSEIVIELKNRNWTNQRIAKQLGMDEEEVLRLCQISGLENLFSDNDFSRAWEAGDDVGQFEVLTDETDDDVLGLYKIPNESDTTRVFHTYDKWECHKAGFYKSKHDTLSKEECEAEYIRILSNPDLFWTILDKVLSQWKYSCEHYLTNKSMNRLAWLGQAAVCFESGVPSCFSYAFYELTKEQQDKANEVALFALNKWLETNERNEVEMELALSVGRQIELY